jgi:Flp pilus assembly protein TadD
MIVLTIYLGTAGIFGAIGPAFANKDDTLWVSRVISVQGRVAIKRHGETTWQSARLDDVLYPGDQVRVEANSRAGIVLRNDAVLRLDQNTTLVFTEIEKKTTFIFRLLKGAANFFSRRPRSLKILTPFVNGAVEGTEFFVQVDVDQTRIDLFEGRLLAFNPHGEVQLSGGQGVTATAESAPQRRLLARPRDSVQWALYYPPIMVIPPGDTPDALQEALGFYSQGRSIEALDQLNQIEEGGRDAIFYSLRAALLLHNGNITHAQEDITQSLYLNPENSEAFALRAIISVVQNRGKEAIAIAQNAVQLNPESAAAQLALSYAHQAAFDLPSALKAAQAAVTSVPESGTAHARLAELHLSTGKIDSGVQSAKKAVALNPNVGYAHTMLGYAYLAQIKIDKARIAFKKSITLDSTAPLPRLGLGLAKIRDGELASGRSEIEIAASLDPNNSLIRSYLGKVYFEARRTGLDGREYAIAKELDPNDPTPYFYDAIAKQTTNRPVKALHDLQKARELNDNRAVYRSRLLLDSDEAARSAALARIYSDLGFQQRALVEGWQAINTDPGDFSGHRFLADSYAVLPRHEIARVSELLQSQLLQPRNITPIQPRLAESNLFLISAGGPADLSYNEFNPIFNCDQLTVQGSGLWGENHTYGGEGVVSGIYQKVSGSGGHTHFETEGFRENNDQKDDITNVFAQYELTYQTSIQAEYRHRETEKGDLLLRFDTDNFSPNYRQQEETDSIRLGFHHAFSPASRLIGNFRHSNSDLDVEDEFEAPISFEIAPGIFVPATQQVNWDTKSDNEATGGELQYLFRSKSIDIISGAGYVDTDSNIRTLTETSITLGPPFPPTPIPVPIDPITSDTDVKHTNLYLYTNIKIPENVTFTIGASGDFFDGGVSEVEDKNQFNPKIGVVWNPVPNTTLRGAIFRTLTRTLVDAQTVEPTQVAGFNQFFDEVRSTDAWRYGGAIDQKFSKSIYGGVEYSMRELEVPASVRAVVPDQRRDWEEYLGRAYFLWAPHKWLGFNAEYLYEQFDYDIEFNLGAEDVKTHGLSFGTNFFHHSGLSASLKATHYDQKGVFKRVNVDEYFSGQDNFWVIDAAINYRLCKRYGFITVGATNLFDEEFKYFDTDLNNPRIQPDRYFFARVTLAIQ